MTEQSQFQGRQQMRALLAQRRQVAANATKGVGTLLATKGPRNLLLQLDHAQIALGQIVGSSRQLHRLHL